MRLSFKIALRFLRNNLGQTLLILTGIAVGVSVQIFIGLLIQGLQQSLINKTIGSSPQITITALNKQATFTDWEKDMALLEGNASLTFITASADGAAFAYNNTESQSVVFRGMQLANADGIYHFTDRLTEGNLPASKSEVMIGKNLKEALGVNVGDTITVKTQSQKFMDVKIVGILDLKIAALNDSWMISDLNTSQTLFGYGNTVSTISMQVKEVFASDTTAVAVATSLNDSNLKVADWKSANAELLSGLSGQSISSTMIQVFVMVSVVLAIASVLAITVMQKSRQLGILKAMGIKDSIASLIFIFQGLILGLLGAIAGVGLGLGLCIMFVTFAKGADGSPVVPLYINMSFILLSAGIAVISSLIASFIPAKASLSLNPIEVIRNG